MKQPHKRETVKEPVEEKPAVVGETEKPAEKPDEKPGVQPGPVVGSDPTVHGEAAQRFVNKNSRHSERVQNGTPRAPHERYEHPERK